MNKNFFSISIIISCIILALSILIISNQDKIFKPKEVPLPEPVNIQPVNESDHILGNPNAPIIIVEYSDFECPYCQVFHKTMQRIMDEFGKEGQVAWVYRHFPIVDSHPNSYTIAMASECVANWEKRESFWAFSDIIFNKTIPKDLSLAEMAIIAEELGMPQENFISCVNKQSHSQKIDLDIEDGKRIYENDAAEFGTPYNIIITKNGIISVAGAAPYDVLKEIILQNL
jgi:protein-disulfide isomerase